MGDKLDEYEDDMTTTNPDKLCLTLKERGKKIVINTQRAIKEIGLQVIQGHGIFNFYLIRHLVRTC
ncbi:MAG: hypothetical protein CM1200mP28_00940 [Deltaproteobacteria bacterium]|nr:MAG: hypothetical protein CM1200mP28_00940 [Deltaproteobacteria bacterium]